MDKKTRPVRLITQLGLILEVGDRKLFLPFDQYPELTNTTIKQIFAGRLNGGNLCWDDLDIDVDINSLADPDQFPLKYTP